jgi:hypothetical protein
MGDWNQESGGFDSYSANRSNPTRFRYSRLLTPDSVEVCGLFAAECSTVLYSRTSQWRLRFLAV